MRQPLFLIPRTRRAISCRFSKSRAVNQRRAGDDYTTVSSSSFFYARSRRVVHFVSRTAHTRRGEREVSAFMALYGLLSLRTRDCLFAFSLVARRPGVSPIPDAFLTCPLLLFYNVTALTRGAGDGDFLSSRARHSAPLTAASRLLFPRAPASRSIWPAVNKRERERTFPGNELYHIISRGAFTIDQSRKTGQGR